MIKGVNRQVVEVMQPESKYFERVLLFVRPECFGMSESSLRAKANSEIKKTSALPPATRRKRRIIGGIKIAAAAAGGAIVTAIINLVLN